MNYDRASHGIIKFKYNPYVFGGYYKSSEKHDILSDTWQANTDMPYYRSNITCVSVKDKILMSCYEEPLIHFKP